MNIKEMLKVALERGPLCSCEGCRKPATFILKDGIGYLCDDHTHVTSRRAHLMDVEQIREIIRFLEQE